jgi:hypothetical protein
VDAKRCDRPVTALAGIAGRRESLRSLSGAGVALLAALGLADRGAAKKNGRDSKAKQERHRNHGHKRQKGERGKTGPSGPTGPAGSGGVTGPTGPAGGSPSSVVRTGSLTRGRGFQTATAECLGNEHAVGGGFVGNSYDAITFSQPVPATEGEQPTGWFVAGTASSELAVLGAFVICVPD